MRRDVFMAFFKPIVLPDVVQIIPSNDDRPLHFGGNAHSFQNLAAYAHVPSEWALFVDVIPLFRFFWRCETKTNVSPIPQSTLRLFAEETL